MMNNKLQIKSKLLLIFLGVILSKNSSAQMVSTFAGLGAQAVIDGALADCQFSLPEQMAFDSKGNLYIVDENCIRKIDVLGNVSTFAGNTIPDYVNGHISVAQFNLPLGIAIDIYDNIYVSEEGNSAIRKIDTLGIVSTYAGTGVAGYVDGADSVAQFRSPAYMCFDDSLNLYVADSDNDVIRKIDSLGNVSTFVGSGIVGNSNGAGNVASFNRPICITYDKLNHIFYVSDRDNNIIRKIDGARNVTTFAGDGTPDHLDGNGTSARFNGPKGLITDSLGNLFVAGRLDYTIRKIDPLGNVSTIAGTPNLMGYDDGEAIGATFGRPISILFDNNKNLLVGDYGNYVIRGVEVYTLSQIREHSKQTAEFLFYPNPNNGDFYVNIFTEHADIIVNDLLGNELQKILSAQKNTNLNINKNGVYTLTVRTKDGISTQRIIVNK
ncbi:MAG TPA: T9SS type A sorting domain-containing protein [Bacteroidia bacterium]|nr:T9SS type A sorting domain-containing protein [Bacteroidia bacterium]